MRVKKRNGDFHPVDFNKISKRIQHLVEGLDSDKNPIGEVLNIDPNDIAKDVCGQIIDGISTWQLDEFAAELCAYKVGEHYHYATLASRIIISNHHKKTEKYQNFSDMVQALYNNVDLHNQPTPLLSDAFYQAVMVNKEKLDAAVNRNHVRDYENLDYFGFKTLEKGYLLKLKNSHDFVQERYQHLLMREAFAQYLDDVDSAIECYEALSLSMFTHATPTLFNSGTRKQQLSSCFLLGMDDSIDGMYECMRRMAHISKWAGGIGVCLSRIRASGSIIRGTNGDSSGLVPLLKVINDEARHVNQGGKRKGSVALYIEPWHGDIFSFLDMKKNNGNEELRARDLFYALWIPDIFMRRVQRALLMKRVSGSHNIKWSLMCPDECPGLVDKYGSEFDELYDQYEKAGRYKNQVDILTLWQAILDSHKETSLPYMLYKDSVNRKSNQKNVGTIVCSNLCGEIAEFSDHTEYAVCNLISLNLKKMVKFVDNKPIFDFNLLHKMAKLGCRNLNRVIDITDCPVAQATKSNFRHRAIGIGVQGLADAFFLMGYPFESELAQILNEQIFDTIYHGSLEASMELAQTRQEQLSKIPMDLLKILKEDSSYIDYYNRYFEDLKLKNDPNPPFAEVNIRKYNTDDLKVRTQRINQIVTDYQLNPQITEYQYLNLEHPQYLGAYSTFVGSPTSQGLLQFDLCEAKPTGLWDYVSLKAQIQQYGLRNSLLVAVMPTATTAQILGSVECIEPITSNLYVRQVLSGSFLVVNRYLQKTLTDLGLWNKDMKDEILVNGGSIANIERIPEDLRQLFKTVWEMSKKTLINMAAKRQHYIDQSQSFNLFVSDPTDNLLTTIHFHGWESGLKTGMYYLRRQTLVEPQKFSVDINKHKQSLKTAVTNSISVQPPILQGVLNPNENPCESGACGT